MIIEFENAFSVWFDKGEEKEEFSLEASTDGESMILALDIVGKQALINALEREDVRDISIYFSKAELMLLLKMLWMEGTIKGEPKLVWPFSFKFQRPRIRLEIK